jgi:hypothetical protein
MYINEAGRIAVHHRFDFVHTTRPGIAGAPKYLSQIFACTSVYVY